MSLGLKAFIFFALAVQVGPVLRHMSLGPESLIKDVHVSHENLDEGLICPYVHGNFVNHHLNGQRMAIVTGFIKSEKGNPLSHYRDIEQL